MPDQPVADSPATKGQPHTPAVPVRTLLAINGGSSSIKFALFELAEEPRRWLSGNIDRIGMADGNLKASDQRTNEKTDVPLTAHDHAHAVEQLIAWLGSRLDIASLAAIGHRIVHGGPNLVEPCRIDDAVLEELRRLSPFDPEHLPGEIDLVEAFRKATPQVPQVACFDTAFHRHLPAEARLLAIPRKYAEQGIRRYGFHGLSYAFLMEELGRLDPAAAQGRVVLAHLGNGASMAAVSGGKCVDTTMAFTPTAGLVMGTRSGDFDPGLVLYLARQEKLSFDQFHEMVNRRSGLLGLSETSSDMRDLLARRAGDSRAAEAVAVFCYHVRKTIGAFAAALGGIDCLVFSGGIGENAHEVRAMICQGLDFLGIALDRRRNETSQPVISADESRVPVRVMHTDEELMIAKLVRERNGLDSQPAFD
ncbi:MAG TPA: acetate/propionate family kinase [Pirellulales bacterium]|nr:acetate/propionate family kinase [Pirellulales bacterium]